MRLPPLKRARLWAGLVGLGALTGLLPDIAGLGREARADGALPGSLGIMLPGDKPQEIVLGTNFGLIISDDSGSTWVWTCEQIPTSMANIYAVGPPPVTAGSLGDRFYALSPIKGLALSDDGTCSWQTAGGVLAGESVTDFFVDPTDPTRVLAASAALDDAGDVGPASIYQSMDGGTSFGSQPLFTAPAGAAIVGVEIARMDPNVIYVAYYLTVTNGRDPVLVRSPDGGKSWNILDVQAALGPNMVRIFAVDPANSNLVYLRVIANGAESVAITRDGGMTFAVPLTIMGGSATAFARLASGTVLVGARINFPGDGGGASGAGYRSTDGGLTFLPWTLSPQPHIVGLAERVTGAKSTLYLSGENYVDGWALASSSDEGATVTPLMSYDQVRGIKSCAQQTCASTCNYEEMQAVWDTDVCTGALLDAGTVAPPPSPKSGCHCGAAGEESPGIASLLILGLGLLVQLRRPPPSQRGGRSRPHLTVGERLDSRRTAV
jgi:MYXO-CTERM domain-containing protein